MNQAKSYLKEIGLVLGGLALLFAMGWGAQYLLCTEDVDGSVVSRSVEASLGKVFKESITHDVKIVHDPLIDAELAKIVARLQQSQLDFPFEIEILVAQSGMVNAIALPGGLIVLYSGLINRLDSAEQLAAVLAHELGHIYHRDSMMALVRELGMSMIIAALAGDASGVLNDLIRQTFAIQYSRAVEERTDSFALDLLVEVGIDPIHLALAFENMKEETDLDENVRKFLSYLETHPDINLRIEKAKQRSRKEALIEIPLDVSWEVIQRAHPSIFDNPPDASTEGEALPTE
jgi:beta-barrel assembly-enhancing protease